MQNVFNEETEDLFLTCGRISDIEKDPVSIKGLAHFRPIVITD